MHHRRRFHLQPLNRQVAWLYSHLARSLAWGAIEPVPLTIGLIDYPVTHGGSRNIDHSLRRHTRTMRPLMNERDSLAVTPKVELIVLLKMNIRIRLPRTIAPPIPASVTVGIPKSLCPPADSHTCRRR